MSTQYDHLANYDLCPVANSEPVETPIVEISTNTRQSQRIKRSKLENTTSLTLTTVDSDIDDSVFSIQQFQVDCINIVKTDGTFKVLLSPKMASKSPQCDLWEKSMDKEVQGHFSKASLVIQQLPSIRPYTVKGKWTFKVKKCKH